MITKAQILQLPKGAYTDENGNLITDNKFKIYIPLFRRAGESKDSKLSASTMYATLMYNPGSENGYKVGDIVYISFENNQMGSPVILGKLYLNNSNDSFNPSYLVGDSLNINKTAHLPLSTKIGDISGDDLTALIQQVANNTNQISQKQNTLVPGKGIIIENSKISVNESTIGSIIEIPDQYVRISDLATGIFKLTYAGTKYLYYKGASSSETHTVRGGDVVILYVNQVNSTVWNWYYINSSTALSPTIFFGFTTYDGAGQTSSKGLNYLLTSHQSIKTLNTDNATAQTTSASENVAGSGTINLHKVAKTGDYGDLLNKPHLYVHHIVCADAQPLGNAGVIVSFTLLSDRDERYNGTLDIADVLHDRGLNTEESYLMATGTYSGTNSVIGVFGVGSDNLYYVCSSPFGYDQVPDAYFQDTFVTLF